jgi:hypothetical protein
VSEQRKSVALAMARFEDVRAVGALAEALEFNDYQILPIVNRALIRLLPRLQASDAPLLSPHQRACLNRALQGREVGLILAILKAWEQVGDSKAIPDVQYLAEGRGEGRWYPSVRRAAKECLPALKQSAERQQIGSQLLRASEGDLTSGDALLRPVQAHSPTESPEQLLRPNSDAV